MSSPLFRILRAVVSLLIFFAEGSAIVGGSGENASVQVSVIRLNILLVRAAQLSIAIYFYPIFNSMKKKKGA